MASPKHPVRVLSLDGGGIRGLSTLYMLDKLMSEIERAEPKRVRPHEYFDLIVGTSTGGCDNLAAN
ncbi:hypothetical protein BDV41DRAFT_579684 [Aspergillus transmontanensis]|uniref:PNPLA domain-containing protein n=1 Tax=Aspergillus transmontanensis TaxID=1034304 RepID=A0A5N6VP35_9EURO|nr:hypothetical protein BDV41DRAFT_579684 [Aspergillus transmontanensis]